MTSDNLTMKVISGSHSDVLVNCCFDTYKLRCNYIKVWIRGKKNPWMNDFISYFHNAFYQFLMK